MPRIGAIVFGGMLLAVTFASGLIVGRLWPRQPLMLAGESSSKPAAGPRRSGLIEAEPSPPRGGEDKLTFYRTLTAPLGPAPATTPAPGKAHTDTRPRTGEERAATPRDTARPERGAPGGATAAVPASRGAASGQLVAAAAVAETSAAAGPDRPAKASPSSTADATGGDGALSWAVQVGVFKGRQQAETVQRKLVEGGVPASLTPAMVDGETRYRVRAGAYRTRAEAERMAERLRTDRALPTYITLN